MTMRRKREEEGGRGRGRGREREGEGGGEGERGRGRGGRGRGRRIAEKEDERNGRQCTGQSPTSCCRMRTFLQPAAIFISCPGQAFI